MDALFTFREIWGKNGRTQARLLGRMTAAEEHDDAACMTVALLEAGLLSPLDLRGVRLLCDAAPAGPAGEALQIFLNMMYAELRRGSIRLGAEHGQRGVSCQVRYSANLRAALGLIAARSVEAPCDQSGQMAIVSARLTASGEAFCERAYRSFREHLAAGAYRAVIGAPGTARPIIVESGAWGEAYYFQKYYRCEEEVLSILRQRLKKSQAGFAPAEIAGALRAVCQSQPLAVRKETLRLNFRQQIALALACHHRTLIITGGPGTGKTSVVVQLIRCLARLMNLTPEDVRIAAPTGRAAARLQESIYQSLLGLPASLDDAEIERDRSFNELRGQTLHRLLKFIPSQSRFTYSAANPIPARLIVVDEVSMVDLSMFARLLQATSPQAHLILLGDRNQLPSVDAGAVLGDLAHGFYTDDDRNPSLSKEMLGALAAVLPPDTVAHAGQAVRANAHPLRDHLVVLTQSHRSEASLHAVSGKINLGRSAQALALARPADPLVILSGLHASAVWPLPSQQPDGIVRCEGGGCRFVSAKGADDPLRALHSIVRSWARFHYIEERWLQAQSARGQNAPAQSAAYPALLARLHEFAETLPDAQEALQRIHEGCSDPASPVSSLLAQLFAYVEQARILTILREGPFGAAGINRLVQSELAPVLDKRAQRSLFSGMPIMIGANDYRRALFNGDVGVVVRVHDSYQAFFRRRDGFACFAQSSLPGYEPAFAATIHKSQGSEYDMILLVLPLVENVLMTREIAYTAITRARYFAGIVGDAKMFSLCVERSAGRISGIAAKLMQHERPLEAQ